MITVTNNFLSHYQSLHGNAYLLRRRKPAISFLIGSKYPFPFWYGGSGSIEIKIYGEWWNKYLLAPLSKKVRRRSNEKMNFHCHCCPRRPPGSQLCATYKFRGGPCIRNFRHRRALSPSSCKRVTKSPIVRNSSPAQIAMWRPFWKKKMKKSLCFSEMTHSCPDSRFLFAQKPWKV